MYFFSLITFACLLVSSITLGLSISKGLNSPIERKFFLFNLCLFLWQLNEFFLRTGYFLDFVKNVDKYFSIFYIIIGYLLFDLVVGLKMEQGRRYFLIKLIMLINSTWLFVNYITFPAELTMQQSNTFGYIYEFRENSKDFVIPIWNFIELSVALFLLIMVVNTKKSSFVGLTIVSYIVLVAVLYAAVSQFLFPILYNRSIPGLSIILTGFLVSFYFLIQKNFILIKYYSGNLFDKIKNESKLLFVFNKEGDIFYPNPMTQNLLNNISSITELHPRPKFVEKIMPSIKRSSIYSGRQKELELIASEEKIGKDYFKITGFLFNERSSFEGGLVMGVTPERKVKYKNPILSSFNSFKRISDIPNSFLLEVDLFEEVIRINEEVFVKYPFFGKRNFTFFEFFWFLKGKLQREDFLQVISFYRLPVEELFQGNPKKTTMTVNSQDSFYSFEVGFKKIGLNLTSNNYLIYISDVTHGKIPDMDGEWVKKQVPWIVSHVFRKPVANVLGLLNIIKNDETDVELLQSAPEILSLIQEEIKDLDLKLDQYVSTFEKQS